MVEEDSIKKADTKEVNPSNTFGILGLIAGILAIFLSIVYIGLIFAILAITFYFIQKKIQKTSIALVGLILGIIGLIFSLIMIIFTIFIAVSMTNTLSNYDNLSQMEVNDAINYCNEDVGSNIYSLAICYAFTIEENKNETIVLNGDICKPIEIDTNKHLCFMTLAQVLENKTHCNNIDEINLKNECLKN
ncbi:MAG: hypothetical protein KC589_02960 [Nanoarchaeota archaeon]|nr:hypothetical protein [Nanoarchaeota archaeon]